MHRIARILLGTVLVAALAGGCAGRNETALRQGERIVFFGDSITEAGVKPGGYVSLIESALQAEYADLDVKVIGAGISGNKVPDLLGRVDEDVLAHNPTTVVIYIGINDVWHWENFSGEGTTKEDFDAGLRTLVNKLQGAGARVVLCTPSVIGEKEAGQNPQDEMLDEYAGITRRVALEEQAELCDLRRAFVRYLKSHNLSNHEKGVLTTDGVHLNSAGNWFVADQMMRALTGREL